MSTRGVVALVAVLGALTPAAASAAPAGARAAHTPATTHAPASPMVLPFIADDYSRAVAEARARKVPLFIEAWAPW